MVFSVIYSFDTPGDESVNDYYPPNWRKRWDLTECSFDENGIDEPDALIHERTKHRKVCAVLTKNEFLEFVYECDLIPEGEGCAIGAPGFGISASVCLSFTLDWSGYYNGKNGYAHAAVIPIPLTKLEPADDGYMDIIEIVPKAFPLQDRHWERIASVINDKIVELATQHVYDNELFR